MNRGYWSETWRQFKKNRLAVFGLAVIVFMFFIAVLAPFLANERPLAMKTADGLKFPLFRGLLPDKWDNPQYLDADWSKPEDKFGKILWRINALAPYSPNTNNLEHFYEGPSASHWLGTDDRGRDMLSRLIWGSRISLSVGFIAVGIAVLLGVPVGAIAGYYGGRIDWILNRIIEVVICFPTFFIILAILAFLPQSIFNIMIVIGITGWVGPARLIRGEFLKLRGVQYVEAVRALGASNTRTIFRHILPNAVAPVLVSATFGVASAILVESSLSFLGFGVPPPTPSWGEAISQAQNFIDAWWLTLFPGFAIFLTVTSYNLVGEGFRDATDPRLRGSDSP